MKVERYRVALIFITIIILTLFSSFCMAATTYTDVEDTKYEDAVDAVIEAGILSGTPDGIFGISKTISRAETAKLLVLMSGKEDELPEKDVNFSDVDANHWAKNYINLAIENEYMTGYPDGTFQPSKTVSNVEFISMCINLLNYDEEADLSGIWPANYLVKAAELGILDDFEYTNMNDPITRGELTIILYNILENFDSNMKMKIRMPIVREYSYEYTGDVIDLELKKFDEDIMKIEGNTAKLPGKYVAKISFINEDRYSWINEGDESISSSEPIEIEWEIYSEEVIKVTIPELKETSYYYGGVEQKASLKFFQEAIMEKSGDVQKNCGDHTIHISLKDKENYIWSDGSSGDIELNWCIKVATIWFDDYCEFEYNGKQRKIDIEDVTNYNGNDEYLENLVSISGNIATDVGVYQAILSLNDKENSKWSDNTTGDKIINWEITKGKVEIPYGKSLQYTGEEQEAFLSGFDYKLMIYVSGDKATNVGTYEAVISLKEPNKYEWIIDEYNDIYSSDNQKVSWEITKARVSYLPREEVIVYYNGEEHEIEYKELNQYSYGADYVDITGNKATNVGQYIATLSLKDKNNYEWYYKDSTSNKYVYDSDDKFVAWEIKKTTADVPKVKNEILYFNGEEQEISLKNFYEDVMEITENKATNVGKYKACISLKDKENYMWRIYNIDWQTNGLDKYTYTTEDQYIDWEIKERMVYIPHQLEIQEYTGENQEADLYKLDLSIMNVEGNEGKNVGKYTAKVSLKDKENYVWETWDEEKAEYIYTSEDQYIDWEIGKSTLEIYKKIQRKLQYTGEEQEVDYLFEICYRNKLVDETEIKEISISGDKATEIGEYEKVLSLNDKENYVWKIYDEDKLKYDFTSGDQSAIWKIVKAELPIPYQKNNLRYDGGEQEVNLRYFDEEIMNISGDKATEIGTYTAEISLKYPDKYEWKDGTTENKFVEWEINKGILEWWSDGENSLEYNGEEQSFYPEFFDEDVMEISGNIATLVNNRYYCKISIKDKERYEWEDDGIEDIEFRWRIVKGNAKVDIVNRNLIAGEDTELRYIVTPELTDGSIKILYEKRNDGGIYTSEKPQEEGLYKIKLKLTGDSNLNSATYEEYIYVKGNEKTSGDSTQAPSIPSDSTQNNNTGSNTNSTQNQTQSGNSTSNTNNSTNSTNKKPSGGGGGGGGSVTTTYKITVTFGKNGKISPEKDVKVEKNSDKVFRITPDEGYQIKDVLVDGNSVGKVSMYVFEKITEKHKIEALFEKVDETNEDNNTETSNEISNVSGDPITTGNENFDNSGDFSTNEDLTLMKSFKDISRNDWYYNAVEYVTEKGLFKGVNESEFAAKKNMNRAMIVTVLHRLAGEKSSSNNIKKFSDVGENMYYSSAVSWAVENNIVNGTNTNEFTPLNNVTREQLVVMLYRYAKLIGEDTTVKKDLSNYDDFNEINSYAKEAFAWAVQEGIITGRTSTSLAPKGTATRAEVAMMLMRFEK